MHCWNLTQTLSNPNDPQWDELASDVLGEKAHPSRKTGFLLARQALQNCLREQGVELEVKDLNLINYSQIKAYPSYTFSLSHTENWGAAIVGNKNDYRSLGIDIESNERTVSMQILERIRHPEDKKLRNIELWCLKEAAFKALMNSGLWDAPVEFSSLRIGQHTWSHSPSKLEGEWELDKTNGLVVGRAFLKK